MVAQQVPVPVVVALLQGKLYCNISAYPFYLTVFAKQTNIPALAYTF
jgi:hypothetical protein